MKRRILGFLTALLMTFSVCVTPVSELFSDYSAASAAVVLSAPTFVGGNSIYSTGKTLVTLKCATTGADIYYSTGGKYIKYTKPFTITKNTTVKCYSVKDGKKSAAVSRRYYLYPKLTASAASGRYYSEINVKLSTPVSGVKIYYTLDGSKPTAQSKLYTGPIKISKSTTLNAVALKSGWTKRYITCNYTIAAKNASLLDDYKGKYLYSTLNYDEKIAYARLFDAVKNFRKGADISDLNVNNIDEVKVAFSLKYENPQFFYIGNGSWGGSGTINAHYEMTKAEAKAQEIKLKAAAKKIADKALKQSDIKERLRVIHDEIIKMTTYEISGERFNGEPDGPLLMGKARCEGYAKAFCYVAQMCGVDTLSIEGFAASGAHLWNMVRINNKWVHVDVTFDDSNRSSVISHEYFCVDDEYCGLDHMPSDALDYPTGIKYNEKGAKAEFDKFMKEIKANYDKGIMTTRHYVDRSLMGSFLYYCVCNMNGGVYSQGINMQPYYCYYSNWVEIELRKWNYYF